MQSNACWPTTTLFACVQKVNRVVAARAQVFQNNNRKEEMLVGVQILGRHWHYMCKEGRKKELAIRNSPEPAQSHGSIPDDASPQDDASLNCE
ncbi:TPA: hypothetical protein ACH3X1_004875 [Trebouxia sp. C0004]